MLEQETLRKVKDSSAGSLSLMRKGLLALLYLQTLLPLGYVCKESSCLLTRCLFCLAFAGLALRGFVKSRTVLLGQGKS